MIKKLILAALICVPLCGCAEKTVEKTVEKAAEKTADDVDYKLLSETLGHLIVKQLKQAGFPFNFDQVIKGIRDERDGKAAPLNEEEYEQMVCSLQEQMFNQTAEKNLADANLFLKENGAKAGVQSPDPKLQFSIAKQGSGETVRLDSIPLIHYTGKLIDGTVFATSETMGEPVALPIQQSIPGFAKGLVGMQEGEKRILYIHPELAYGVSGQLPPNSLLIFEVEIVKANSALGELASNEPELEEGAN